MERRRSGSRAQRPPLRALPPDRYRDFTPVGEGGQGIVYWALDTELNREVAFKVLRPGAGNEGEVTPEAPVELRAPSDEAERGSFAEQEQRFLQEAWVTAGMEHQGILPVYELGRTEEGIPYYTMRYVAGSRTLADAVAERRGSSLEERLNLLEPFLKVCDAIRYAHDRGVVHRDVKPANVALGEYGEVVVLDWGLAKLEGSPDPLADRWLRRLEEHRAGAGLRTMTSALGTPGYMSPEATRGEVDRVDARSDVYSLGAILHEILVGRPHVEFRDFDEYARRVAADPITADAIRTAVPEVPALLADLCERALAISPDDRPEDVGRLAETVRTWSRNTALDREIEALSAEARIGIAAARELDGADRLGALDRVTSACGRILELRPGEAAAHGALEHAHRLREQGVRERERAARRTALQRAAVVSAVVLLVVASVAAALIDRRRREADAARVEAVEARERAEELMAFLVFELQDGLAPVGRSELLERIGSEARRYYEHLPLADSPPHSLTNRTAALRNLGDAHRAGGDLPAALEAYRASADAAQGLVERAPDDERAPYLLSLAEAMAGRTLFDQGYTSNALAVFDRHLAVVEGLVERHPASAEHRAALAAACSFVGDALGELGRWEECLAHHERALDVSRGLPDRECSPSARRDGVESHLASARALRGLGRRREALERVRLAAGEVARGLAEQPEDLRWVHLRALCRLHEADLHAQWGAWDEAAAPLDLALADLRFLVERDRAHLGWRSSLARAVQRRGDLVMSTDVTAAAALHRDALAILEELTAHDPSNARWHNLTITLCDRVARTSPDAEEALALRQLAWRSARGLVERDPDNVNWRHILAYTSLWLGRAVQDGDPDRALSLYRETLATGAPILAENPGNFELGVLLNQAGRLVADLHLERGEPERAVDELLLSLELLSPVREAFEVPHAAVLMSIAHTKEALFEAARARSPDARDRTRARGAEAVEAWAALLDEAPYADQARRRVASIEAELEELR